MKGKMSLLAACAMAALALVSACGQAANEVSVQPLCGVILPDSGRWHQVWRTSYGAGGIRDMLRDGDWLWVATPHDVVRLDLDTLDCTRFGHADGNPEVPLSGVRSLMLDPEGVLWAAGSAGLARYEESWQAVPTAEDWIVGGLCLDARGNLWVDVVVDTGGIGPLRFSGHQPPQAGRWEGELTGRLPPRASRCDRWIALGKPYGPRFRSPEECRLLASWRERLATLPPPRGFAPWGDIPSHFIAAETTDRVWALTRHPADEPKPYDALVSFDGRTWQVLSWPYPHSCCLTVDEARGGIWVGTSEGLVFSDGQSIQRFLLTPGDLVPLGVRVYDLVADGDGRLWASTGRGLLLYDEASDAWQPTELTEPVLMSADYQGGLWAISRNGLQASHFDGETWTHHPSPAGWRCMPTDVLGDAGGGLWLSSRECVLRGFNGEVWDEYDSGSRGQKLARGPGGDVYAAERDGTIRRYDGQTWEVLTHHPLHLGRGIDLAVSQSGEVWVASDTMPGLLVYQEGRWTDALPMVDDPITALLVDSQGDLWASHDQGLLHYDGETWESVEIRTPFTGITALTEDRRGRIWAGGQDGLSVYDP